MTMLLKNQLEGRGLVGTEEITVQEQSQQSRCQKALLQAFGHKCFQLQQTQITAQKGLYAAFSCDTC